jgi:hypothetical protein
MKKKNNLTQRNFIKEAVGEHLRKLYNIDNKNKNILSEGEVVTQEDYKWANEYLNGDRIKNDKDYYILDITGKQGVYYTFWHYIQQPEGMMALSNLRYVQNMAMDFKRAIKAIKEKFPNKKRWVVIDNGTTNDLLLRNAFMFPFGKYKNQDLRDVAKINPGYIKWATNRNEEYPDVMNIEVTKNYRSGQLSVRRFNNKELSFVKNLKEFRLSMDLESLGVNKSNRDEREQNNKEKFADLLRVLNRKNANGGSSFISNFITKIERGADTTKFSDKVNSILADIYGKSFDNAQVFQKTDEMLSLLTGKEIKTTTELNIENGQKYTFNLKLINTDEIEGLYGHSDIYMFNDDKGNLFVTYTTAAYDLKIGGSYDILFTLKNKGRFRGEKCYFIKRMKILS